MPEIRCHFSGIRLFCLGSIFNFFAIKCILDQNSSTFEQSANAWCTSKLQWHRSHLLSTVRPDLSTSHLPVIMADRMTFHLTDFCWASRYLLLINLNTEGQWGSLWELFLYVSLSLVNLFSLWYFFYIDVPVCVPNLYFCQSYWVCRLPYSGF